MAAANCTMPPLFDALNGDFFYQVISLHRIPGERWLYEVEYEAATRVRIGVVYVLQEWTTSGRITAPTLGYDSGYHCVVVADVPKAKGSDRPYYVPTARVEQAAYDSAIALEREVLWLIGGLVAVLLIPAWYGFERPSAWLVSVLAAVGIIMVSAIATGVCIESPWQDFQRAHAYWAWFDALPRQDGLLLPLTIDDFTFLLRGPPNDTTFYAGTWAIITAVMAAVWVAVLAPPVIYGCYWLLTPLPLDQVHDKALSEGRAPTVEELDAALFVALVGKSPWQIHVMRRKAEAFMRRFGGWQMERR
jgi:hypothetical protein